MDAIFLLGVFSSGRTRAKTASETGRVPPWRCVCCMQELVSRRLRLLIRLGVFVQQQGGDTSWRFAAGSIARPRRQNSDSYPGGRAPSGSKVW